MRLLVEKVSVLSLVILASIMVFVLSCSSSLRPQSYLLRPTGPYLVGFQDYRFVNGALTNGSYSCASPDLFYGLPGVTDNYFGPDNQIDFCREMMVRVYYPIQSTQNLPYADYYEPAIISLQKFVSGLVPSVTEEQLNTLNDIQTFTVNFTGRNANIVNKTFPVLIFSPGWGNQAQKYENIITDMASHGYIVLAINNTFLADIQFPYGLDPLIPLDPLATYPPSNMSGQLIEELTVLNNILFTKNTLLNPNGNFLPEFINHMQLDHIGLFGHSISGYSIVQAVRTNPSLFQAASYLDSQPFEFGTFTYSPAELAGFSIPFWRFHAAPWFNPYISEISGIPLNVQFQLLKNNYFTVLTPNENNYNYTEHLSFTDEETMQYQPTISLAIDVLNAQTLPIPGLRPVFGTANGFYIAPIINNYLLEFFDQYLKNEPSKNLNKCIPLSKDTILECG